VEVSEAARRLRLGTRLALLAGVFFFILVIGGIRGWWPQRLGQSALPLFFASVLTAAWLGVKSHRRALADREKASGGAIIVAIAAQLGKQDDATLEAIAGRGGPAGEAASLILAGRRRSASARTRAPSGGEAGRAPESDGGG
jgi:hypothetical protein